MSSSHPPRASVVWPPAGWLPVEVSASQGDAQIDWLHFGSERFTEPFFEGEIRKVRSRPVNRMFRHCTPLADFVSGAKDDGLAPNGFIFHMSRCGSTLVSQMLAALPQTIAISEAAPIDAIVRLNGGGPQITVEQQAQMLRAMLAAYGRRRAGDERNYFVKLDCWHTLALPLFRRAFPEAPWLFLYRDPVEVLVSQMRRRGTQMVPELVPASFYGLKNDGGVSDADYCARVLNKICEAAIDNADAGRSLFVNYHDLPAAVWTRILPHFGVTAGEADHNVMRETARRDAKNPNFDFVDNRRAKQREATADLRAIAERRLGAVYARIETLAG